MTVKSAPATDAEWRQLELTIKSLFSPAAPINDARLLAGRKEQMHRLIDAVVERGRHAILFGERGVGKTSLANTFHDVMGAGLKDLVLPIRKQASPSDDYASLWRKVFRDLTYEIKRTEGYGKEVVESISAADLYERDIIPDDVVRELSRPPDGKHPIIIFDEFDKIEDKDTKKLISHTIKSLSDSNAAATLVIVGVADDINHLIDEHESIKRNISEIRMPRMSKDELIEILDERLPSTGLKLEGNARWKIVVLSRGLPEYVHFLGRDSAVHAVRARRLLVKESDVDDAIKKLMQQSDQSAKNAYKKAIATNKSNALYRQVLLACALTKTDDEGKFAPKDVVEPLTRVVGHKMEIANFQSHLTAFCSDIRGHILEKSGSPRAFRYRFREPKMQPYVLMQGIANGAVTQEAMTILAAPEQPRLSSDF